MLCCLNNAMLQYKAMLPYIEAIDKIVGLILSIATIFGVFAGFCIARNYISKIMERKHEAIFNFYSRFHMYLLELKNKLGSPDQSILLLMYNSGCLQGVTNITPPNGNEKKPFTEFVEKFVGFLEDTDNQVPLSVLILDSKYKLKNTLISLSNIGTITPYNEYNDNKPVIDEHARIMAIIDTLITEIESKQKEIAKKIDKKTDHKEK